MSLRNFIRKLLPPYGTSNDTDEQPTYCDHAETTVTSTDETNAPSEIGYVDDHLVIVKQKRLVYECDNCDHKYYSFERGESLLFEPDGIVDSSVVPDISDYIARKELSGATNDSHPEPEVTIVNESENPDFDPDEGEVRTETVEIGDDGD